eukprot:TRINITY_DN47404_c0_g1_i1.p1 TRINITY_DN47404_c0_g1~~TRINITY_DN47404_c0_g1_i1.p1  ORF type:complete len:307 (+),score=55.10 TRINITY_DN47404_c0_g1_i1:49-921(+)
MMLCARGPMGFLLLALCYYFSCTRTKCTRRGDGDGDEESPSDCINDGADADSSASSAIVFDAHLLAQKIKVVDYGVLGQFKREDGRVIQREDKPDADTVFVDPAGLQFLHPRGERYRAGGAAGAIYEFLGITDGRGVPRFPPEVPEKVKEAGQACYHKYATTDGDKACIHVTGPDFRKLPQAEGEERLVDAYRNVFAEFSEQPQQKLRLLPISGSIFAGSVSDRIHTLTFESIITALGQLDKQKQQHMQKHISSGNVVMCIFDFADLLDYQIAFGQADDEDSEEDGDQDD